MIFALDMPNTDRMYHATEAGKSTSDFIEFKCQFLNLFYENRRPKWKQTSNAKDSAENGEKPMILNDQPESEKQNRRNCLAKFAYF